MEQPKDMLLKWSLVSIQQHPTETNEQIAFVQTPTVAIDISAVENDRMTREMFTQIVKIMSEAPNALKEIERLKESNAIMLKALTEISDWKLPESGSTWDDGSPMSYEAAFGSNGARDYIRSVASDAIIKS